jgi:hypothetical protein
MPLIPLITVGKFSTQTEKAATFQRHIYGIFISTSLTSTFQCHNSKASAERRVDEGVIMQLLVDIFSVRYTIPHHLFDFNDSLRHMTVG